MARTRLAMAIDHLNWDCTFGRDSIRTARPDNAATAMTRHKPGDTVEHPEQPHGGCKQQDPHDAFDDQHPSTRLRHECDQTRERGDDEIGQGEAEPEARKDYEDVQATPGQSKGHSGAEERCRTRRRHDGTEHAK